MYSSKMLCAVVLSLPSPSSPLDTVRGAHSLQIGSDIIANNIRHNRRIYRSVRKCAMASLQCTPRQSLWQAPYSPPNLSIVQQHVADNAKIHLALSTKHCPTLPCFHPQHCQDCHSIHHDALFLFLHGKIEDIADFGLHAALL